MKNTLLLILMLLVLTTIVKAQADNPDHSRIPDNLNQVVKHNDYTTYYDAAIGEPDSVKWTVTAISLSCATKLARLNVFTADPLVPNTKFNIFYEGSGQDQGHQYDADDASCNITDEKECWYYTNMVPQCPNLNRITWRALENYTRKLALKQSVNITCGVTGTLGNLTGIEKRRDPKTKAITLIKHPSGISIPKYCWKRLVYGKTVELYVMPNQDTVSKHKFNYYRVK